MTPSAPTAATLRHFLLLSDDIPAAAGCGGTALCGVLRFGFPWPGFTPCTWLTTLSRDDLIERAGALSAAKLSEIDDAQRAAEQGPEWTPAAAARLSEIKDSLRRRTQADGGGTY